MPAETFERPQPQVEHPDHQVPVSASSISATVTRPAELQAAEDRLEALRAEWSAAVTMLDQLAKGDAAEVAREAQRKAVAALEGEIATLRTEIHAPRLEHATRVFEALKPLRTVAACQALDALRTLETAVATVHACHQEARRHGHGAEIVAGVSCDKLRAQLERWTGGAEPAPAAAPTTNSRSGGSEGLGRLRNWPYAAGLVQRLVASGAAANNTAAWAMVEKYADFVAELEWCGNSQTGSGH